MSTITDGTAIRNYLQDYIERLWNRRDLTAIDDYVPATFRMDPEHHARASRITGATVPWDRRGLRLSVATVLRAHSAYHVDLVRTVVEAPHVVFVHETTGITAGPHPRPVHYRGVCRYSFQGQMIIERHGAIDAVHYLRQVGAAGIPDLPAPPI